MSKSWLERFRHFARQPALPRDAVVPTALGLALRLAAVAWAAGRFPPVEDGRFYHTLATRIAAGSGYTWQWPDGVVTNVAHYPVGYPGLLAGAYRLFGASPTLGMLENAVLGALAVLAVHRIAAAGSGRLGALTAAFAVALHPALVLYTPALMTEGVTAALLALAGWISVAASGASGRRRLALLAGLGALLGASALVRGQSLLFAPLFAAITVRAPDGAWRVRPALGAALLSTTVALLCVLPWSARNCAKMDRCVAISANLGWNLLIGSVPDATGTFVPITGDNVPEACRTVFGEADKDACFTRASLSAIASHPGRWLSLAPAKLSHTFDYCGAAGWYLHASNPGAFSEQQKLSLGIVETAWQRGLLALALAAVALGRGPRAWARRALGVGGGVALLTPAGWLSYLAFALAALLAGREARVPTLLAAVAVLATALTHVVFFGAGRYSLVVFALVAAAAGVAFGQRGSPGAFSRAS